MSSRSSSLAWYAQKLSWARKVQTAKWPTNVARTELSHRNCITFRWSTERWRQRQKVHRARSQSASTAYDLNGSRSHATILPVTSHQPAASTLSISILITNAQRIPNTIFDISTTQTNPLTFPFGVIGERTWWFKLVEHLWPSYVSEPGARHSEADMQRGSCELWKHQYFMMENYVSFSPSLSLSFWRALSVQLRSFISAKHFLNGHWMWILNTQTPKYIESEKNY